ncbi:poly(U)-binding-splicing factor half pint-like [Planococcus citri]|uniref:poly(U)-binding-splicing factor half pint-like n=1 Tax=Planococcus citri TaxID=170843 RepID=UPI0031F93178
MDSSNDPLTCMDEISTLQKQQVMALMSCINVGNISSSVKRDDLIEEFTPFGVIESIHMACDSVSKKHAGFAFIEYSIPEAALLAMEQMNGVLFHGEKLEIKRLHNNENVSSSNMPLTDSIVKEIIQSAKQYNRIYIASVNPLLTERDIKFLFEKIGHVKACELPPGYSSQHRRIRYCFIEFESKESIEKALSMDFRRYVGPLLHVGRVITPPNSLFASSILPKKDVYRKQVVVDRDKEMRFAIRAYSEYINFFAV